ncbi:MAG: hypothetical protein MJH10_09460 [Epibacterium sp.]|nr:hypothetical protein [Epibacterium sp.]MCJ8334452.1 hypothetical protein [Epibacterium sp.]NQX73703.1 hypothetical protein [Epibacterium sp.]NQX73762.1 hypothetical protein [Epibacterium sp.]
MLSDDAQRAHDLLKRITDKHGNTARSGALYQYIINRWRHWAVPATRFALEYREIEMEKRFSTLH